MMMCMCFFLRDQLAMCCLHACINRKWKLQEKMIKQSIYYSKKLQTVAATVAKMKAKYKGSKMKTSTMGWVEWKVTRILIMKLKNVCHQWNED